MSSVATLSKQLKEYQNLEFHKNSELASYLTQVQQWQHQRMLKLHHDLFSQPNNQLMTEFLLSRLYNLQDFELLAQQLSKALKEKIKLDRWLPASVLNATELGFELAFFTITLDQHIASYCLAQQLDVNEQNVLAAIRHYQQIPARKKQLQLLLKLGKVFHHFSRSFIIQTAFKMTKSTMYRRGFDPLYHYIEDGLHAMRQLKSTKKFFEQFTQGEKQLIQLIAAGHEQPLAELLSQRTLYSMPKS